MTARNFILRQRSIHPDLFTNEAFAAVSLSARLLAIGLWMGSDHAESFPWRPLQMKVAVLPADDVSVPALLDELLLVGLVRRFGDIGVINRAAFMPCAGRTLDVSHSAWRRLRAAAIDRDGGVCGYCECEPDIPDCDHILSLSRGGRSVMDKLITSCPSCNRSKGARTVDEWGGRA